ncbi:hypothetical protein THASP1DRAFT_17975 [Thamnocephalis sphaerospora]|uniref:NodB homology domain-containing protein n=1 Tax=Thamnocephalis sphaerospora TaxID=78915 RepID=A0A4P9XNB7_9FUNG|nr:hypothetical protein THASP1DRAFT_17975 [Thamnocephalis sphaerospora]|eukprot:RKP06800.1 hypothetical protein THASP1DRAFT_17975 [Thamnocephalis sphaerospora]
MKHQDESANDIITGCHSSRQFALTFDDGPSEFTDALLDKLAQRGIKATFFVVGDMLNEPEKAATLLRAYKEGHQIALHTQSHPHLDELTYDEVYAEIADNQKAVAKVIGVKPRYFRCPFGECGGNVLNVIRALGLKVALWNLDTKDFLDDRAGEDIVEVVRAGISIYGGIIDLQHDVVAETVRVAGKIIDLVLAAHMHPVTVAQCVDDGHGAYF